VRECGVLEALASGNASWTACLLTRQLWAIMLKYSGEIFIGELHVKRNITIADFFEAQTGTQRFLEVVEELCTSSSTNPVVRERLLEVIAGAAFAHSTPERRNFVNSWRRVKAPGQPDEGIAFDDRDPTFTPPALEALRQRHTPQLRLHAPQASQNAREPSVGEEIRNLNSQCELARNNARVLSEALSFAKPIELASNLVIKEFHTKCMGSQDFIVAQIPWATVISGRSRDKLQEQQAIAASIQGEEGQQQQTPETAEEQLLAALLQANQDLVEVFKQYDELERLGMHEQEENEVALRSLHETKLDPKVSPCPIKHEKLTISYY